jgi:hypothetical protein
LTRPALNVERWPEWTHVVLYRARRDNAMLPFESVDAGVQ